MKENYIDITIREKDLIRRDNDHEATKKEYPKVLFSPSGMLIDELAYSANEWTSEDLTDHNFDYEPNEPYDFDFEQDLFSKTKTDQEVGHLLRRLDSGALADTKSADKSKLQAGAWYALTYPEKWAQFLADYTERVKDDNSFSGGVISEAYESELQEAKDRFYDNLRYEWLNGDRSEAGVLTRIARFYGAESVHYNDKSPDVFTFTFDKEEMCEKLDQYWSEKFSTKRAKDYLLEMIYEGSISRRYKNKAEREKRKAEYEQRKRESEARDVREAMERKAKLLSMKLKK